MNTEGQSSITTAPSSLASGISTSVAYLPTTQVLHKVHSAASPYRDISQEVQSTHTIASSSSNSPVNPLLQAPRASAVSYEQTVPSHHLPAYQQSSVPQAFISTSSAFRPPHPTPLGLTPPGIHPGSSPSRIQPAQPITPLPVRSAVCPVLGSVSPHIVPSLPTQVASSLSVIVNSSNGGILSKFVTGIGSHPPAQQAVAVIQPPPGSAPLQMMASSASLGLANGVPYNASPGIIYALSQYPPYFGLNSGGAPNQNNNLSLESENSNLGPEDVAEVRLMTRAAAASSVPQDNSVCHEPGKCQSGGELRLTELQDKLPDTAVPEGFCLVGAKSPMLIGLTLIAAVDRRYLPSENNSVAMLGFSGNCIGCGAAGFRYFTEFSTHINLKLATQPKKQKHLKYYVVRNKEGKWSKGPSIPWKGSETRKRSVPAYSIPPFGKTPELVPSVTMAGVKENQRTVIVQAQFNPEPQVKKQRLENETQNLEMSKESTDLPSTSSMIEASDAYLAFKLPVSVICGVRPVLLLCQNNTFKLPHSVNDIIISDLLVGCFSFTDSLNQSLAETASTSVYGNSIMSTGTASVKSGETSEPSHSNVEQSAASALVNMSEYVTSSTSNTTLSVTNALPYTKIQSKDGKVSNNAVQDFTNVSLPLSAAILLLVQHLCNVEEVSCITREEIEVMLNKARVELCSTKSNIFALGQALVNSSTQLSMMANLQASSSQGKVKIMTSRYSFQNGIYKALRWLHDTFFMSTVSKTKLKMPHFIFILSTPTQGPVEFGILVTGVTHSKILAESLGLQAIVHSSFEEDLGKLKKQFGQTEQALNWLTDSYLQLHGDRALAPFRGCLENGNEMKDIMPKQAPWNITPANTKGIFSNQAAMAQQLLSQLSNIADNPEILELPSFVKVEVMIVVPPVLTLYYQTVKRLCDSGLLNNLGLETEDTASNYKIGEKYVITYSNWPDVIGAWSNFLAKIDKEDSTLFILIFDQAQMFSLPQGMPDVLPNLKEVFESTNVIPLFVTSVPYMFQSQQSFIDPDNEVYWTDAGQMNVVANLIDDRCTKVNDLDTVYFGIKEVCNSTRWNQQYPLVRHDETFDLAVPKANRVNEVSYNRVQCFVTLRLYRAALMVAAGIYAAEPYTLLSYMSMVRDLVETPMKNSEGSGSMLMIRIPRAEMAQYCYDVLKTTRDSLGFQYRFDVILDDGEKELSIGKHFLQRMRRWKVLQGWKEEDASKWSPRCLEELLDLPCFLILSGSERAGETFPRSLKYVDYHILDCSNLHRSTIEAEIGSVACYLSASVASHKDITEKPVVMNNVRSALNTTYLEEHEQPPNAPPSFTKENCAACLSPAVGKEHNDNASHFSSRYPLPLLMVSKPVWLLMHPESSGMPGYMNLNPDPNTCWVKSDRPLISTLNPDHQSRHYRKWTHARTARKMVTTPGVSIPSSPTTSSGACGENVCVDDTEIKGNLSEGTLYHASEPVDTDENENEDADKDQYHPRCLLLSGPPQIGKTGAYLHFTHLLHRMLLRLKRIEVCDNRIAYNLAITSKMEGEQFKKQEYSQPNAQELSTTKFVSQCLDTEYASFSPVCFPKIDAGRNPISHIHDLPGRPYEQVILAKTAAHDFWHHCDICKFYREGIGSNLAKTLTYRLKNFGPEQKTIDLEFVIPLMHLKYFLYDEVEETLNSLILSKYDPHNLPSTPQAYKSALIKSPIFMTSSEGHEEGLLNLFHAMEENDHAHLTFINKREKVMYRKNWPNHMFVVLPDELDSISCGGVKQVIKLFATQNHEEECRRQKGEDETDPLVWPFVMLMSDNISMWQRSGKENEQQRDTSDDTQRDLDTNALSPFRDTSSLRDVLVALESMPLFMEYGLIGFRPWSFLHPEQNIQRFGFLKTFVHSLTLLNVVKTKQIQYSSGHYIGENLDFQIQALATGVHVLRVEQFSFMSKVTNRGQWRMHKKSFAWEQFNRDKVKGGDSGYACMIANPDYDDINVIDAPSHLVMQKYLRLASNYLFACAVGKPLHPILTIGRYIDLGNDITVCVVNTKEEEDESEINIPEEYLQTSYSGLLVYNCSKGLTKELLSKFKFEHKAKLVFVASDRYSMREEVTRLDLEERWRFRLKDEYQTATAQRGEALFFLKGSYCHM